jgi:putative nucleotidyltransferase with HDIG domain
MADLKDIWRRNRKYLSHLVFFLSSILIVVIISPRGGTFRYEFQKGKPWMGNALIAPWDFSVLKSESQISDEQDSILKDFSPYFNYDAAVYQTALTEFEKFLNDLKDGMKKENPAFSEYGYMSVKKELTGILTRLYESGIIESDEAVESAGSARGEVTVVKDRVGESRARNSVFRQKEAYQEAMNKKEELARKLLDSSQTSMAEFTEKVGFYDFIRPNLIYDAETSSAIKDRMLKEVSLSKGLVQEGELIITRGEIVNDSKFMILESIKKEYEKRIGQYSLGLVLLGRIILVSACYMVLYMFLYNFRRKEVLDDRGNTFFILLLILLFVILTRMVISMPDLSVFLIPIAIIPIIVRTFFDSRLALFVHMITIMLAGFIVQNPFEFVFLSFVGGTVAIFSLTNIYRRSKLFFSSLMVVISYSTVYFGIGIIQEGSIISMDWSNYSWFAANGILLLLSYPMIFIFEKSFGFLSDATLFELSDTNQPLLRRLAQEAPGSFQHSLQVANLAEEAARAIGANPLLARTGALYHDIGKVADSEYFIENQSDGFNPHETKDPLESAKLILNHVDMGVELAKKYKLPARIIEFITTHHGTSVAYYFYKKYADMHPEMGKLISGFTYHGPKPYTKETAILMMADSVEASSRALSGYSEENIRELVERIVYLQEQDGQFSETPLTFGDLTEVKKTLVRILSNIYHARISYPKRTGR